MTDRLSEIKASLEAASPRPWDFRFFDGDPPGWHLTSEITDPLADFGDADSARRDAEFVANAPTYLAYCIERIEELEGQTEVELRAWAKEKAIAEEAEAKPSSFGFFCSWPGSSQPRITVPKGGLIIMVPILDPTPPEEVSREALRQLNALRRIAESYPDIPYQPDECIAGTAVPTNRRLAREALVGYSGQKDWEARAWQGGE